MLDRPFFCLDMNIIQTYRRQRLADTHTPVSLYLKLRDHYENPVLLESNDSQTKENSFSYIGLEPIAGISITAGVAITSIGVKIQEQKLKDHTAARAFIESFFSSFQHSDGEPEEKHRGQICGFFGYMSFEAVQYYDSLSCDEARSDYGEFPDFHYNLYKYVITIDHFTETLTITQNCLGEDDNHLDELEARMNRQSVNLFPFTLKGNETSDLTDEEFMAMVTKGKAHCKRGDVFQLVLSRRFQQGFQGDEFNVYRILRSINPSPYLFYFDFGNHKIFGSSPEAQLIVKEGKASVNPIAGTYKRTGNDTADAELALQLLNDPKEVAEHTMLVDLARNDLGKSAREITVSAFKDVQYFSHVIHLVSTVEGHLKEGQQGISVLADTFPAGTLSGAPKYKAIELINEYEHHARGFYGGAIGYIGLDGSINHAITIRSFLSKDNCLYYQAGAGIVEASEERSEMEEVNNKLAALKKAFQKAEKL